MSSLIQVRRGSAAEWSASGPILSSGEIGYEVDTGNFKVGDGTNGWNSLGYQLPYYTGLKTSFDNATISVDSANDRVGIGTVAPTKKLDVAGSVGISTTLAVTGDTTLTGDLAVNGGDITTTSTTGNLFNATVTTLNLASVATAVSVGSASAVITVPSTTDASSSTTGSIKTAGGVGIAKKLYVGTDASVGGTLVVTGTVTLTAKATSAATVSGDGSTTLVTKGYVDANTANTSIGATAHVLFPNGTANAYVTGVAYNPNNIFKYNHATKTLTVDAGYGTWKGLTSYDVAGGADEQTDWFWDSVTVSPSTPYVWIGYAVASKAGGKGFILTRTA